MIELLIMVIKTTVVFGIVLTHVAYTTYAERKIIGRAQARMGPMEVGPHGLLQPIADFIKIFFKEDIVPINAEKFIFQIAPLIVLIFTMINLTVIPFTSNFILADLNVGLLFILASASVSVYGIILAGWSSNSKYSFLGGLRSASQVLSYEIALGLSLAGVVLAAGSLNLRDIVIAQHNTALGVYAIPQIIGFVVFVIAAFAETNRAPFDLPEAETELVAGYLTEYSAFRYALFFLAEYVAMYIMASLCALCFLGGWTIPKFITDILPFLDKVPGIIWFAIKVYAFIFLYIWVRATFPRYRFDQLLNIGWKVLIPAGILNIIIIAIFKRFAL
ncbi:MULTISPECIES: NADH-quinone oxidoreductase subunit NuoH [Thermodesulfovibrio]|uniref:NADH-quinone oxidoreductase subunit H n=2 Tax=Thermodesulfovibrio yellowstonii TaxID=28262 RepID=B5YL30_THEYD|nr:MULTISPECIES: NADH-quinone oxidoreductase subunit NuoH [Thermodesulfovibrio]ACI20462.1 NADH-quinone oxidoreductase chain h [Thermodesulfovibrio yellowstonii DSM 11347]MDI6864116.1 NADH-quinone oxidoreductase subunit NuoH [Thermodesulfovibrio yellowstonii]